MPWVLNQACNRFTVGFWCQTIHKKFLRRFECFQNSTRGHSTTTWTRRGGGGVSQKSTLVHSGGGGSLECPRGPKPSYFRKYFILLCSVMGGKTEIKLHWIELNSIELNWFIFYSHWKLKVCEFTHVLCWLKWDTFWNFRGEGAFVPLLSTWTRGGVCKMSTLVHSRGGGGQIWTNFSPRSCWMPPNQIKKVTNWYVKRPSKSETSY